MNFQAIDAPEVCARSRYFFLIASLRLVSETLSAQSTTAMEEN